MLNRNSCPNIWETSTIYTRTPSNRSAVRPLQTIGIGPLQAQYRTAHQCICTLAFVQKPVYRHCKGMLLRFCLCQCNYGVQQPSTTHRRIWGLKYGRSQHKKLNSTRSRGFEIWGLIRLYLHLEKTPNSSTHQNHNRSASPQHNAQPEISNWIQQYRIRIREISSGKLTQKWLTHPGFQRKIHLRRGDSSIFIIFIQIYKWMSFL